MKYAKIGGQAVIEGVMMRYKDKYAVTVRKPNGEMETKQDTYVSLVERLHLSRVPIIRGVFSFIDSLILGFSTLMYSSSFYDEEPEPSDTQPSAKVTQSCETAEGAQTAKSDTESVQAEGTQTAQANAESVQTAKANVEGAQTAKTKTEDMQTETEEKESMQTEAVTADPKKTKKSAFWDDLMMLVTVVLALVIAVGLFMILPFLISDFFARFIDSSWVIGILEGVVRILIFMAYIIVIALMPDVKRTYMYHGAEHKSINCIEHGDELTPENAMKYSRFHKRCGTSFLFFVIFISVIVFILFFQIFPVENRLLKIIIRLLLVPVIAGVSYEIIQWAGRHNSKLSDIISKPGLFLQRFTTAEPDESMLECAIASIEAIYDWRAFQEEARQESEQSE